MITHKDDVTVGPLSYRSPKNIKEMAEIANKADAKRWVCEKGGQHEILWEQGDDAECGKCHRILQKRWEVK